MLLFRFIDAIASKKKDCSRFWPPSGCELKPILFLIILDCTRKKNEEKLQTNVASNKISIAPHTHRSDASTS